MVIIARNEDLTLLYNRAKKKYHECINYQENKFLQNEIGVPLRSIQLVETDVKIVFSQESADTYLLEICLTLYTDNKSIGKYVYTENEMGKGVDDSLVFY